MLQQRLWPETFVAEANLSNLVAEIREALGDRARAPAVHPDRARVRLRVLRRRRSAVPGAAPRRIGRPVVLARVGHAGAFRCQRGEHVIGRDPDVEVRLDASTVSRRHARLVVTAEGTMLEDFGSKNGTFRGGERVTSPVPLADGDAIHIGSLLVTFHVRRHSARPRRRCIRQADAMIRAASPVPIATGTRIGPYEIVGWLGAGGMGEVYRARDPRLGRDVAIKLIPETFATDASRVHRFEQEARAAGQLNHPNILAVYDVGTHAGAPYIVSELLEGEIAARPPASAARCRRAKPSTTRARSPRGSPPRTTRASSTAT